MSTFEILATVGDKGEVRIEGVPFAPGTAVDVIIQPVQPFETDQKSAAESRTASLFAALDQSRNTQSIASFRRDEVYDRDVLR